MIYNTPSHDVAEVTLIGTGGGYGESCIIHYGNNCWAVVDSCINPDTNVSLPLEYLQKIGVDLSKDVKLIVCTHWHNDHILGLSQLVKLCTSATFCFGKATDRKKFLYWVALDYEKVKDEPSASSTKEFAECLELIRKSRTRIINAYPDRILDSVPGMGSSIISLSPSDYVIEEFDNEISELIGEYGSPAKKYVLQKPNDKSVVLLLEFGIHRAILGADLEVSSDNRKGWLNILDYSTTAKTKKASLFKISHHGSKNGYHDRIWLELLEKNPLSKITPWNRNQCLPEPEMINLYSKKTNSLYITAPVIKNSKPKKRDKSISKIIDAFNIKVSEVKFNKGIVRSRININDPNSTWSIDLDGNSFHINTVLS